MGKDINFTITDFAVNHFKEFLAGISDYEPTLCFVKGQVVGRDKEDVWGYGAYAPENISSIEPELRELGYPLIYKICGLEIAIPQHIFVHELNGKVIEIIDGRMAVLDIPK